MPWAMDTETSAGDVDRMIIWACLLIIQNFAFTLVSRARTSESCLFLQVPQGRFKKPKEVML